MIVSQATAQRFWGDDDPLGRIAPSSRRSASEFTVVVGVVGDVRQNSLNQESPSIYYASTAGRIWPLMDIVVRTEG